MKSRVLLAFVVACALLVGQLGAQDLREPDKSNASFKDAKNSESNKLSCYKCLNNNADNNFCYEVNALTKTKQGCDYCQIKKFFSADGQLSIKRGCLQSVQKNKNELNKWITTDSASVFVCNDGNLCNSAELSRHDALPFKRLDGKSSLPETSTVLETSTVMETSTVLETSTALETSTTLKVESTSSSSPSTLKSTEAPTANSTLPPLGTANTTQAPTRFSIFQVYNNCCSKGRGFMLFVFFMTVLFLAVCTTVIFCSSSCCASDMEPINETHSEIYYGPPTVIRSRASQNSASRNSSFA